MKVIGGLFGFLAGCAVVVIGLWSFYLLWMIAEHVNAWPIG